MDNQSLEQPSHYWLATNAEVAQVASRLGISLTPDKTRELTENFSRILLLGEEPDQRVLKIRARWMTERRIRFEHALAACLCDSGLPFVAPLPDERGCTWTDVGGLYCEVAPYVDGREAGPFLDDVRLMGSLLGRFHACTRDLDLSIYEPPHFRNQAEPRELEPGFDRLRRQEMEPADSEKALAIRARWEELTACYERQAASLPQALRHGDFHPWNLLFSRTEPSRIAALFDLDMTALGARVYDISYTIYMMRNLHPEHHESGWDTRFLHFIASYAEASGLPFTPDEAAVAPLQIECIGLAFLMRKAARAGWQAAVEDYETYLAIVDWLRSWGPELSRALGGAT